MALILFVLWICTRLPPGWFRLTRSHLKVWNRQHGPKLFQFSRHGNDRHLSPAHVPFNEDEYIAAGCRRRLLDCHHCPESRVRPLEQTIWKLTLAYDGT